MPTYAPDSDYPAQHAVHIPRLADSSIAILCLENPVFSDPSIHQLPYVQDQNRPRGAGLACRNRLPDAYAGLEGNAAGDVETPMATLRALATPPLRTSGSKRANASMADAYLV
ncbi:hypothetical protein RB213_016248 [Colletotrichum asianum]